MIRTIRVWSLLALAMVTLSHPSQAGEPEAQRDDAGTLFNVPGAAAALGLPPANVQIAKAPASSSASAASPRAKQSGADLYYFTPQEAAAAKKRFGVREQALSDEGYTFDSDVPAEIQAQMKADLAFINGIQGGDATPLHRQIFGLVDGPTYTRFFDSRVTAIGLNDCGSSKAVACVIPGRDPSKMWITQNYIQFSHPQIARLMVVFHESRHTETQNDNWPHATCPTPFVDADGNELKSIWTGASLAGEPACDTTPFGSYGSSTILLKNIQKFCKNCTKKEKQDAGLYADDQMNRIISPEARGQMEDDLYK